MRAKLIADERVIDGVRYTRVRILDADGVLLFSLNVRDSWWNKVGVAFAQVVSYTKDIELIHSVKADHIIEREVTL